MGLALEVALLATLVARLPTIRLRVPSPPPAALESSSGKANPDAQVDQLRHQLLEQLRLVDP